MEGPDPHPVIECLNLEQLGRAGIEPLGYYRQRAEGIALMTSEPLLYGFEPEIWAKADEQIKELRAEHASGVVTLLILGGNRASKTVYAAKRVMQTLTKKANRRGWCLQSTEAASRADQQGRVYDSLPASLRNESGRMRMGKTTKVVYSRAGGFTENTFVLPNGSQAWVKFYGGNVKHLGG